MKNYANRAAPALTLLIMCFWGCSFAAGKSATVIPSAELIQPADLAASLRHPSSAKPLILQVGFRKLYDQAHIPGAEYAGPASGTEGLRVLRERVVKLPKAAAIVIYCGCCPWNRCPNIAEAYDTLHALGFSNLKVLYIADNFGSDWVDKGFPTTIGK